MQKSDYRVGIVGFGTMGVSLAQLFAQSGFLVHVVDAEPLHLAQGMQRLQSSLDSAVKKNLFSRAEVPAIMARVSSATVLDGLRQSHLVIEAVFENRKLKQQLFKQLQIILGTQTLVATNTSSFQVRELMPSMMAKRGLGLHYFYPPAQNRLLEVVFPDELAATQRQTILDVAAATGRVVIHSQDESGFVVNRFFVPWLNEAVRLMDESIASLEAINALSKSTFASPLGAFEVMNLTGLAPVLHSMETFAERFNKPYQVASGLIAKGKENSPWDVGGDEVGELDPKTAEHIFDRLQGVVFYNVERLLKDGICSANDIEIGARIGLRWGEGPISSWRKLGAAEVKKRLSLMDRGKKKLKRGKAFKIDSMNHPLVLVRQQTRGTSAILELNRPQAMNALSLELLEQLEQAFDLATNQKAVQQIILRGTGKTFAAGGDLTFLNSTLAAGKPESIDAYFSYAQKLFLKIDRCPKPVIAFVEGLALGGGVQLALAADWIVATPAASFAFPETGLGLLPGLGGTQRLPRRLGRELAKYFIFTGESIEARRGSSLGLVDAICDDLDWHSFITTLLADNPKRPDHMPSMVDAPQEIATLISLMNNKNTSRLVQGKSRNLPEGMEKIESHLRSKERLALQLSNHLLDQVGAETNDVAAFERGLQMELEALKQLVRQPTVLERLKELSS